MFPNVRKIGKFFLIFILFVGIILGIILYFRYKITPIDVFRVLTEDTAALKQANNRVNLVLLGIGGGTHEGGDLTDTIQVMSIDLKGGQDVMIALPRDIYVPSLKDRINAAFRLGKEKNPESGLLLAKATVEEVVGLPIHYAVLLDFSGFVRLIDTVGGIEVAVAESFTDTQYPIAGRENDLCDGDLEYKCRYETISFATGSEHMDGARALKYVRSRYAEGDSGNDFSRGKRQQAVLLALKNKLLTKDIIMNRSKLLELERVGRTVVTSDLTFGEELLLGRLVLGAKRKTEQVTIPYEDPEKQQKGLLIHPPEWQYDGKWVLIPKADDFSQIREYINCSLQEAISCDRYLE